MKKEDKELLLKDLCARLPYRVKVQVTDEYSYKEPLEILAIDARKGIAKLGDNVDGFYFTHVEKIEDIKPYLRPMSSMTEEEAKTFVTLWGIEDFISLDITEEYIGVVCDDGFSSTTTTEIWYDGDMPIECFDFLNAHHLDYRGLIPIGLALPALEGMY